MPKQKPKKGGKAKAQKKKEKKAEKRKDYEEFAKSKKEKAREKKKGKKGRGSIEKEFKEELNNLGYFIREVDGDGNCLFRSVSDQLEDTEKNHRYYREKTIEYMRANKDEFQPFIEDDQTIDEYIDQMEKDKEWGGNLEIYAMSKILRVNFYIYIYQHPIYIVNNFDNPRQNIMLTYHEGKHYNSLRRLEEKKDTDEAASGSENEEEEEEEKKKVNDVQKLIEKVDHLNI